MKGKYNSRLSRKRPVLRKNSFEVNYPKFGSELDESIKKKIKSEAKNIFSKAKEKAKEKSKKIITNAHKLASDKLIKSGLSPDAQKYAQKLLDKAHEHAHQVSSDIIDKAHDKVRDKAKEVIKKAKQGTLNSLNGLNQQKSDFGTSNHVNRDIIYLRSI